MNWIKTVHIKNLSISHDSRKQKQFGWLIALVCLLVFALQWYQTQEVNLFLIAGVSLLFLLSFLFSKLFAPFLYIWMWMGSVLSEISSFLVLFIIYYLLFVPITVIFRIKKKVPESGWQTPTKEHANYDSLF